MQKQTKFQKQASISKKKKIVKRQRTGRWTPAESNQFQSLLQRYGKNWMKIYQKMKRRTLSQIRSHAQKYFNTLSQQKILEYQTKAKLIKAYEILENQKRLQKKISKIQIKPQTFQVLKKQQDDISQNSLQNSSTQMPVSVDKLQKIIKEQNFQEKVYPFAQQNTSFLTYLIEQNFGTFLTSNFRIETLIDEPGFRAFAFKNI